MSEPTEQEIRNIAWHMTEVAHFGRGITGEAPACATFPPQRMAIARAMWCLGARHDGRGELHGPTENLSEPRRSRLRVGGSC